MMMLTDRKFSTPDVAELTGLNVETLQSYLRRGFFVGMRDGVEGGGAQGKHRRFSWYALMQIAIGAELIKAGLPAKTSFDAAMHFSHVGEDRSPGFPFPDGYTFLIAYGDLVEVVQSTDGSIKPEFPPNRRPTVFHVVDASGVFDRICFALKVHPELALTEIYG